MAWLTGLDGVEAALKALEAAGHSSMVNAAQEIGALLESYAKLNHGKTPRPAGRIHPPGSKGRMRSAGIGWGDVTGNTNNSTRGGISEITDDRIVVSLTAGMDYDVFLELARSGKWSWLWPALMDNQGRINQILAKHGAAAVSVSYTTSAIPGAPQTPDAPPAP